MPYLVPVSAGLIALSPMELVTVWEPTQLGDNIPSVVQKATFLYFRSAMCYVQTLPWEGNQPNHLVSRSHRIEGIVQGFDWFILIVHQSGGGMQWTYSV